MHEMSLVRSLLIQVEDVLTENNASLAKIIEVEIGPLSGVESQLVESAYHQFVVETRWCDAKLVIRKSPLVILCLECDSESELADFVFRCAHCQSGRVQIIKGESCRLLSLTVEEPDSSTDAVSTQDCSHAE